MAKAIFTLSALSADATSITLSIPSNKPYSVYQNITAVSSADTLDTAIQESPDGGTTWFNAATFAQVTTAATKEKKSIGSGHADQVRLNYDVTGSAISIDGTITVVW